MKNKTAIITGGSKGIGKAITIELAQKGCNVVINYSNSHIEALELCEYCKSLEVEAIAIKGDVSKRSECENIVNIALDNFKSIDILVNNAGITKDVLLMKMTSDDFDKVIDVNLKGTFNMMQCVSRTMIKQKSGKIINISSVVGLMGNASQVNYAASKAGVIGMTKSFAKEVSSRKINVNAVAPGFIETDMTAVLPQEIKDKMLTQIPANRFGTPSEVAKLVSFLASEDAKYITGQVISIDGGMCMA